MKLGVQLNSFDWSGGPERFGRNLADIGRVAEEAGFDRIGVADHLWQHPIMGGPEANEPECYTTLAFLAANTDRIRLTAMVSGVHFRHPAVLVKAVSTLDVLSGGRACFGVGEEGEKVDELVGQLHWLAGMGVETVIGFVPGVDRITPLEIIGREVIPVVAEL